MFHTLAKATCLAGALTGAAALSQYPAFADQYVQRLGGTVDALSQVVQDFDTSALASGLTRSEALDQMTGTPFLEARQADMRRTVTRHVILTDQLARLRSATALDRIWLAPQLRDAETLRATWGDYTPALPVSTAGAVTTAIGFVTGWASIAALLSLLSRITRRKPRPVRQRIDPPLTRTTPYTPTPKLMGDSRP